MCGKKRLYIFVRVNEKETCEAPRLPMCLKKQDSLDAACAYVSTHREFPFVGV